MSAGGLSSLLIDAGGLLHCGQHRSLERWPQVGWESYHTLHGCCWTSLVCLFPVRVDAVRNRQEACLWVLAPAALSGRLWPGRVSQIKSTRSLHCFWSGIWSQQWRGSWSSCRLLAKDLSSIPGLVRCVHVWGFSQPWTENTLKNFSCVFNTCTW